MIASHVNAAHSVRKRFTESEADKLHSALKHKTRLWTSKVFQGGDQVIYAKRDPGKSQELLLNLIITNFLRDMEV